MRYLPLDLPIELRASQSALVALDMVPGSLMADFIIPDEKRALLVVEFYSFELFRVLDEMPLSTEPDEGWEGHVPDHLAYEMEGTYFWDIQSDAFKAVHSGIRHYRFVTCDLALDVLSYSPPLFTVMSRDPMDL